MLACSDTVMVLVAPGTGVLCPIARVVNTGTTTLRGSAPPTTPRSVVPGLAMALRAMLTVPEASTRTAGEAWSWLGFVTRTANLYAVPAAIV